MANNLTPKEIFNGTDGAVWLTTDTQEVKVGSMKTFTLKQANQYADVDESESYTKKRKLVAVELSGEFTKWKIDNTFINLFSQYKDGKQPDISIIGKAYNNNTNKVQRVKITGVTFDELNLIDLAQKTPTEESLPYSCEDYDWLENS